MESKYVGVEKKDDKKAIEKMLKMKEQSEAHHKQMLSALNKGDDAAIVGTFMKLAKENQLTKENGEKLVSELQAAKTEQEDLQLEFEQEREELLETIRQLERQNMLLEAIIYKAQPLIPRACNYYNMDAIRLNSQYQAEKGYWRLPAVRYQEAKLPGIS